MVPVNRDVLTRKEIISIYREVLEGKRRRFPNGFFDGSEGLRRAAILTRYLIRQVAGMRLEEIPKKVNKSLFYRHKLTWMLGYCFNWSPYLAVENAYPGRFHPWQFNIKGMWKGKNGLALAGKATRWMIEKSARIPLSDVPKKVNAQLFAKHNLRGMLALCFKGSFYQAIDNAYPGLFQPWEFANVPKNFWRGAKGLENAREAIRWVVEKKLSIPPSRIYKEVTYEMLRQNGLGGLLTRRFAGSSIAALQHAFPEVPFTAEVRAKRRRGNWKK